MAIAGLPSVSATSAVISNGFHLWLTSLGFSYLLHFVVSVEEGPTEMDTTPDDTPITSGIPTPLAETNIAGDTNASQFAPALIYR